MMGGSSGFFSIVALALTGFVNIMCFTIFAATSKTVAYSRYLDGDRQIQSLILNGYDSIVNNIILDLEIDQYTDFEFSLNGQQLLEKRLSARWLRESGKVNVNWITHEFSSNKIAGSAAALLSRIGVPNDEASKFLRYLELNDGREFTSIFQPIVNSQLSIAHVDVVIEHFSALPANSSLDLNVSPTAIQTAVIGRTLKTELSDAIPRDVRLGNETLQELIREAHRNGELDQALARHLGVPGRIEVLCLTPMFLTTYGKFCRPVVLPK